MKAAVFASPGKVEVQDVEEPHAGKGQIRIKVFAVGQNPADWKALHAHGLPAPPVGRVLGHDFAGVVDEIGDGVKEDVKLGDRVAGFTGNQHIINKGPFAEYAIVDPALVAILPEKIPFESAQCLGAPFATASQMLWQSLELPHTPRNPNKAQTYILVWAASGAVGQFLVQLAALSGYTVVATASSNHHDLIKRLGASAIFDYRDPDVAKKVKEYTGGKLTLAADAIGEHGSGQMIANALSAEGGKIAIIMPYNAPKENVQVIHSNVTSIWGVDHAVPAIPEHHANGRVYYKLVTSLLAEDKLVLSPTKVFPKGLHSVNEGMEYHKDGKVSGERIVYRISDTL